MTPLQSSSLPLHVSTVGGLTSQVCSQPFATWLSRFANPGLQRATVHCRPAHPATAFGSVHRCPHPPQFAGSVARSNPSSTSPSQSSSRPLQLSIEGPAPAARSSCPPLQKLTPAVHCPQQPSTQVDRVAVQLPTVTHGSAGGQYVEQRRPTMSSGIPLQSLSRPSQISA